MKCLIFDLFHLYDKVKKNDNPVASAINVIRDLEKKENATHTIVVKSDTSRSWRSNMGVGYKNPASKIDLADSISISKIIAGLEQQGFRVEGAMSMEASDIFGTISSKLSMSNAEIVGYTDDIKSLFSINEKVIVKNLITGKVKSQEWVKTKFKNMSAMKAYYANIGVTSLHLKPAENQINKIEFLSGVESLVVQYKEQPEKIPKEVKDNLRVLTPRKNLELGFSLSQIKRKDN